MINSMKFQENWECNLPEANLFLTRDSLYAGDVRSKLSWLMVDPSPVNCTATGAGVVGPREISKRARNALAPVIYANTFHTVAEGTSGQLFPSNATPLAKKLPKIRGSTWLQIDLSIKHSNALSINTTDAKAEFHLGLINLTKKKGTNSTLEFFPRSISTPKFTSRSKRLVGWFKFQSTIKFFL